MSRTAAQTAITPTQTDRVKTLAKRAAHATALNAYDLDANWWVGEYSHELGIVDARGMIDVDSQVAHAFRLEYRRALSRALS